VPIRHQQRTAAPQSWRKPPSLLTSPTQNCEGSTALRICVPATASLAPPPLLPPSPLHRHTRPLANSPVQSCRLLDLDHPFPPSPFPLTHPLPLPPTPPPRSLQLVPSPTPASSPCPCPCRSCTLVPSPGAPSLPPSARQPPGTGRQHATWQRLDAALGIVSCRSAERAAYVADRGRQRAGHG
jgi:hypothetical protein